MKHGGSRSATLVQYSSEMVGDFIDHNILKSFLPGFDESDLMLVDNIRVDLVDATVILAQFFPNELDHDELRLLSVTVDLIQRAMARTDVLKQALEWKEQAKLEEGAS